MEFLNLKPQAFGLDISDNSLKIAKLKKKGGFLSLASFGEFPIKPGIIEAGEIKNEDALVSVIKESLAKVKGEKLRTKYAVVSLPEEEAFMRVIQMPNMAEEELKSAVQFEAENHIPLPISEVYLDFQVVQPLQNHLDHLDVLIAALPRKIVDPYVSCLKKAGLIPLALEIESQAIARATIKNEVSPVPVLLADLGATSTRLGIYSGYALRLAFSIPVSSRKFTEALVSNLKITFDEAEKIKIKYGLEKPKKTKLEEKTGDNEFEKTIIMDEKNFEALVPVLTDLVEQIKKYIDFYQTHTSHEHLAPGTKGVEKVLLCGGGANLKGLVDFLSLQLKIPVELANPWVNILPKPLKEVPELSFEKSLAYTTALGLALRGVENT